MAMNGPPQPHIVDIAQLLENYAWQHYQDLDAMKKVKPEFRNLDHDDVHFELNTRKLIIVHDEPDYRNFTPSSAKPYTLFKTVFSNSTARPQSYSFKTERSTESIALVCREQGWSIGQEAEISMKTPCEVLEFKAGFKHEMHFDKATENSVAEILTWGVDSTIDVPANSQTTAELIVEEMSYAGSFIMNTRINGRVTVSLHRRRDNALIMAMTANFAEIIKEMIARPATAKDFKAMTSIDKDVVRLCTKGQCSFQFAMKQHIKLSEAPMLPDDV